jgi:hypothetical protein
MSGEGKNPPPELVRAGGGPPGPGLLGIAGAGLPPPGNGGGALVLAGGGATFLGRPPGPPGDGGDSLMVSKNLNMDSIGFHWLLWILNATTKS